MANIIDLEAQRRDRELKKLKLRYEVMARTEVNAKLSEVNAFLERRAEEQTLSVQERDKITEKIQKDLSQRLLQSRHELGQIKDQLKGNN